MNFSISSLVRSIVLLGVVATMAAVSLARLDPPRAAQRRRLAAAPICVDDPDRTEPARKPLWYDVDTGRSRGFTPSGPGVVESAVCSPWVDDRDRRQVVGRWLDRTAAGPDSVSNDFGLARYSFPDGELLDQVSCEIMPIGRPCWYPSTRARVLFASGNGALYHYAFEPEAAPTDRDDRRRDPRPLPLSWRCPQPGDGEVYLSDPTWSDDPRLANCVLVALRRQLLDEQGARTFGRNEIWWLRLDAAGTEVVETGRLLDPIGGPGAAEPDVRSPATITRPDGRAALAYLRLTPRSVNWELRLTPIEFGDGPDRPRASEAASRQLAARCFPGPVAISTDGGWVGVMVAEPSGTTTVKRIAVGPSDD